MVLVVGEPAAAIAAGARSAASWDGEVILTASREEALSWLRQNALSTDVVLTKASRGAALEEIAEVLLDRLAGAPEGDAEP